VGEVLELSKPELLRIRNFGEKSYSELFSRLREMNLLPPELDPDVEKDEAEEGGQDTPPESDE
jgi:DNA-directed RNA polymerase alpha subunit